LWSDEQANVITLANLKTNITASIVRYPQAKRRLVGAWPYPLTHQIFLRRGGVGRGWRDRQERGDGGDRRVGRIDTLLIIMASL